MRVAAGNRKELEHLCRYAGRPAIAESRLQLLATLLEAQIADGNERESLPSPAPTD